MADETLHFGPYAGPLTPYDVLVRLNERRAEKFDARSLFEPGFDIDQFRLSDLAVKFPHASFFAWGPLGGKTSTEVPLVHFGRVSTLASALVRASKIIFAPCIFIANLLCGAARGTAELDPVLHGSQLPTIEEMIHSNKMRIFASPLHELAKAIKDHPIVFTAIEEKSADQAAALAPAHQSLYAVCNSYRLGGHHFSDEFYRVMQLRYKWINSLLWVGMTAPSFSMYSDEHHWHFDEYDNFLVQLSGRKGIFVMSLNESLEHEGHANFFPRSMLFDKNVSYFVLEPGEAVMIPARCYHLPFALDSQSASLNCFLYPHLSAIWSAVKAVRGLNLMVLALLPVFGTMRMLAYEFHARFR